MKLTLELNGVTVEASLTGCKLNANHVELAASDFTVLVKALNSLQEILALPGVRAQASDARSAEDAGTGAGDGGGAGVETPAPARRGRPPRAFMPTVAATTETAQTAGAKTEGSAGPGRPRADVSASAAAAASETASADAPKRRGRPPREPHVSTVGPVDRNATAKLDPGGRPDNRATEARPAPAAETATAAPVRGRLKAGATGGGAAAAADTSNVTAQSTAAEPKRRGRPPKEAQPPKQNQPAAESAEATPSKPRGRPPREPQTADASAGGKNEAKPAAKATKAEKAAAATPAIDVKRGPGRPRSDGTSSGAPKLVDLLEEWMAANPGPRTLIELSSLATEKKWGEADQVERLVSRASRNFVKLPDGRFRLRGDVTPIEPPKVAKVTRRRGRDEVAVVRVEAPST